MVKQVFFTADHTFYDDLNKIYVYGSFQYNTQTKELKFVNQVQGKRYEIPLGTATLKEEQTSNNGN